MKNTPAPDDADRSHRVGAIVLLATCAAASVVLLAVGGRLAGRYIFTQNDTFEIKRLAVRTHGQLLSEKFVRACVPVQEGTNLFAVNIAEVRDEFMAKVPSVQRMYITRRVPSTLEIEVWERIPLAWIDGERRFVAVDQKGYVFRFPSRKKELTTIAGVPKADVEQGAQLNGSVADVISVIQVCDTPELSQVFRISRVDVAPSRQLREDAVKIELATGEVIDFWWNRDAQHGKRPDVDLRERLEYLRDSLLEFDRRGERVATMDLTFDEYPEYCVATLRQG